MKTKLKNQKSPPKADPPMEEKIKNIKQRNSSILCKGIDFIGVSVGAIILNNQNQILLTKRSQNASNERGCWEAPGGGVDFGETLEDAVKREVSEELGVSVRVVHQFSAKDHLLPEENQHWVATTFLLELFPDQSPRVMEPAKCDGLGWFDLENLPSPLSVITQADIRELKEFLLNR